MELSAYYINDLRVANQQIELSEEIVWELIVDDRKGENIEKMEWLLPGLERQNYSFDGEYAWAVGRCYPSWIRFFLTRSFSNLDLNTPVHDILKTEVHPLNEMRLHATRLSLQWCVLLKLEDRCFLRNSEIDKLLDEVHAIIDLMENHPKIDLSAANEERERLREYVYFEGDPQWERDRIFISEAATWEGLKEQVAKGRDLSQPIGPFCLFMEGVDGDITWIELLRFLYGYQEDQLVDLL